MSGVKPIPFGWAGQLGLSIAGREGLLNHLVQRA